MPSNCCAAQTNLIAISQDSCQSARMITAQEPDTSEVTREAGQLNKLKRKRIMVNKLGNIFNDAASVFKAGPHVVSYGLSKPGLRDVLFWAPEVDSPREKLAHAFSQAGVDNARYMGTYNTGVANCELTSSEQVAILEREGFRPEYGHCGGFSIL
jgi:hypothetical protein